MSLTLRHVRAFVEVARQGSFTRAADKLNLSQPALTITINQIEGIAGVKLFQRTTRRVELTSDGENFLPIAERLVADFDRAISDLKVAAKRKAGQVSVAVLPSLTINVFPEIFSRIRDANPDTRLFLRDDNARGVQRQVRNNESDFGIGNVWEMDPDLEFTALTHDPLGVVCHQDHPLGSDESPLSWTDLEGHAFAGMSPDTGVNVLINRMEQLPGTLRTPEYEVLTMAALGAILVAKLAMTVLPSLAVPSFMHPALVFRELVNPRVERELCLITRRDFPLSPAAEGIRDMLLTETPRYIG